MHKFVLLLAALFAPAVAHAQSPRVIEENFATDPAPRGWVAFGTNDLIHWNSQEQNLNVTWDSSQPNNYFRLPLGTILERSDDFEAVLDLYLEDIAAGVNGSK